MGHARQKKSTSLTGSQCFRQSMETDPAQRKKLVSEIEKKIGRGRRPANPLLPPRHDLLAAAGEGAEYHGQQYLQRLALRRPLAR